MWVENGVRTAVDDVGREVAMVATAPGGSGRRLEVAWAKLVAELSLGPAPELRTCPSCGAEAFSKQVTAAGFQLKGSGWYATDFRNGSTPAKADAKPDAQTDSKTAAAAESKPADAKAADTTAAAPAPAPSTGT